MAMACSLLLTRLPLFKLPFFSLCIARLTDRCALLPYLAILYSFLSIDLIAKPQAPDGVSKYSMQLSALDRAFASGVPYLVNVLTEPSDVYPRTSNLG